MSNRHPAVTIQLDSLFFSFRRFFYETPNGKREVPELIRGKLDDGRALEIRRPASLGAFHLLLLEALAAEALSGKGFERNCQDGFGKNGKLPDCSCIKLVSHPF